jgi:hypothetical protein
MALKNLFLFISNNSMKSPNTAGRAPITDVYAKSETFRYETFIK